MKGNGQDRYPGSELLDEVEEFLDRFVVYPSKHARIAHVLWIAHTHAMELWESTPRIAFLSTEPSSGKTRALEVTETLVPRPIEAVNVTPAYLFRKVSDPDGAPTILYDEIDTLFGPKAKDNEELRGVLNAGHRRGAMAGRCVVKGKVIETEELPAYSAVAMAGLGDLPDTLITRSIVIRMKRRSPAEEIEPYRRRLHAAEGNALRDRLEVWTAGIEETYPDMPAGVEDRDADVWEALLAVADAAGGDWPEKARVTAVTLVTLAKVATPSLGVRLLDDIRAVFDKSKAKSLSTHELLTSLNNMEEAPWGNLKGNPLDARGLARFLRRYDITSKVVRVGTTTAKGYAAEDFYDAWVRYLGVATQGKVTKVTSVTSEAPPTTSDWMSCPACDGEGCRHCGDTGRNPEIM